MAFEPYVHKYIEKEKCLSSEDKFNTKGIIENNF